LFVAPTVQQFQTQFIRDFPYGTDPNVSILDADIINAFNLTDITINPRLWDNQTSYQIAYGYLAAHFLVLNLRASSQGLNGQYNWAQNSKSVNGVSEAFTIPQRVIDNPDFMQYTKTNYGAQYLNLLWPLIVGPAMSVWGRTKS
jgi:hypothetical protein